MEHVTDERRRNAAFGIRKGAGRSCGGGVRVIKGVALLLALVFGWCAASPTVRAQELQGMDAERSAVRLGVSSRGNLVYREGKREAAVCEADFLLLYEKISTIPEDVFDPIRYTHAHQWEYRNVNEKTHTRHCGICGDAFDLECAHSVSGEEDYVICYEGAEYSGRRYRCVCGYQWEREASHVVIFEAVDETNHRSRCLLEDTAFCGGYEPLTEEHYAYRYDSCEDGAHHRKSCIDCGFGDGVEDCSFVLEAKPEDGDDRDTSLLYCVCGNGRTAGPEEDQAEVDGKPEEPTKPEEPEEPTDVPDGGTEEPEEPTDVPDGGTEEPEEPSDIPDGGTEEPEGPSDAPDGGTEEPTKPEEPEGPSDVPDGGAEEPTKPEEPEVSRDVPDGGSQSPSKPLKPEEPEVSRDVPGGGLKEPSELKLPEESRDVSGRKLEELSKSKLPEVSPDVPGGGLKEPSELKLLGGTSVRRQMYRTGLEKESFYRNMRNNDRKKVTGR